MVEMMYTTPFQGITLPVLFSTNGNYKMKPRADMLNALLEQYATRKLTFPSDALDACTGVLKRLETGKETFVSGLLTERGLLTGVRFKSDMPRSARLSRFTLSYRLPDYENMYLVWMAWYHKEPSSRRASLPSWSFLGWDGPVTMGISENSPPLFTPLTDEANLFESPVPSLAVEQPSVGTASRQRLRIRGILVKMQLLWLSSELGASGWYALLQLHSSHSEMRLAYMDVANPTPGEYSGLLLYNNDSNASVLTHDILILNHVHEQEFERVGIVIRRRATCVSVDSEGNHSRSHPNLMADLLLEDEMPDEYLYVKNGNQETFIIT